MHLYGLIIGISFVVGLNFFLKLNRTVAKNQEKILIIGVFISTLIGARLYHVLSFWSFYSQHLSQIPQTWNGGLGIFGGLIGGLIYIFLFSRRYKYNFFAIIDLITPILPLSQAIGRLGNFVNHEIPIWWLESILCLFLFFIIHNLKNRFSPTAIYLIGYGFIRFITEIYRTDTWLIGNIKISQILALTLIASGTILLFRKK